MQDLATQLLEGKGNRQDFKKNMEKESKDQN